MTTFVKSNNSNWIVRFVIPIIISIWFNFRILIFRLLESIKSVYIYCDIIFLRIISIFFTFWCFELVRCWLIKKISSRLRIMWWESIASFIRIISFFFWKFLNFLHLFLIVFIFYWLLSKKNKNYNITPLKFVECSNQILDFHLFSSLS